MLWGERQGCGSFGRAARSGSDEDVESGVVPGHVGRAIEPVPNMWSVPPTRKHGGHRRVPEQIGALRGQDDAGRSNAHPLIGKPGTVDPVSGRNRAFSVRNSRSQAARSRRCVCGRRPSRPRPGPGRLPRRPAKMARTTVLELKRSAMVFGPG